MPEKAIKTALLVMALYNCMRFRGKEEGGNSYNEPVLSKSMT